MIACAGVIPLHVMGMGKGGQASDAGKDRQPLGSKRGDGRRGAGHWVSLLQVWDTTLCDPRGQAGPHYRAGSDRQKVVSTAKQNCMAKVML